MGIWQSYDEEIGSPVLVKFQKGKGATYQPQKFNLAAINLPLKYPQGVKLKSAKLDDLEHLLRFVPLGHKAWFTDLFQAQGQLVGESADNVDPDDPDARDDDILDY